MHITSIEALYSYAAELSQKHPKILLAGDLGVGKTTFVKGFVQGLGRDPNIVSSPTYTYTNTYGPEGEVLHVDMYRIKTLQHAVELGIMDLIDEHDYVLIERPKWIDEYADASWLSLELKKISETEREIVLGG